MDEALKLLLLCGVGIVSGIINVNAGGGSALTLPVLIFLGLDAALANGTNRIGILLGNIFAVASFRRQKVHDFAKSLKLGLFTLPGAVIGALVATRIDDVWFQRILGIIMLGVVATLFVPKPKADVVQGGTRRGWIVYPALVGIGFYGGFIQVGVGFLFMAALYHLSRLDLVRVNMHKVFIILVYTIPAFLVFLWTGNVIWRYGLVLAAGTSFGAWWGARIAVKGGERLIRFVLVGSLVIMAAKLIGIF